MAKMRPIYIMVSRTDTGIARLIRSVTHYPYNHVSLTLDPSFSAWYSFARYAQDAPLYGGFIRETPARLLGTQGDIQVRIFRTEIPEQHAKALETLLPLADRPDSGLIYNHFDALACAAGLRIAVPGCHTCLSFVGRILDREFVSISQVCEVLAPGEIYEGPLSAVISEPASREDVYFNRLGLWKGSSRSAACFCLLVHRTLCHGFNSYVAHRFRRTAM